MSIGGFKFLFALPAFGPSTFLVVKNNYLHNAIAKSSQCSKTPPPVTKLLNKREKEANKWDTNPSPICHEAEAEAASSLFVV